MEMDAIQKFYGTDKGTVAAMKAGVDMVCISHSAKLAGEALAAVWNALERGILSEEEHEASIQKILDCKEELEARIASRKAVLKSQYRTSRNESEKTFSVKQTEP